MIIRKSQVAFFTSIFLTLVYFLISLPYVDVIQFIFVFIYSLIGNYTFGLPVSLLAEWVTSKLKSLRMVISGFIHIGCGFLTYHFSGELFSSVVISSVIFFVTDEFFRR